jgi:hypothetical protein
VAESLHSTFSERAWNQSNIVGSAWRREARNVGKYSTWCSKPIVGFSKKSPSVYYRKKLDYQEALVKELLKRPACMLTGLALSRNLNSKITINAWRIAVGSRHSLMRIQEYWTTHSLATRRGFTYPIMWIPKTQVCGVVKTRMHCSRNPSIPRKSACSVRYHSGEWLGPCSSTQL